MKFSIVIPAFNAEKYIERSINSVLNQSFDNFEIIIVDDGSKDNTYEKVSKIKDERLKIYSQKNQGVSIARNEGIKRAKGDYVCFLDADDEYCPDHLEQMNSLIKEYSEALFFATRNCIVLLDGTVKNPSTTGQVFYIRNAVAAVLKEPDMIWTGCVCIRKDAFFQYGMFEPGVKLGEDVDLWTRIFVHTGVVFSDNVTVKRNRDGSEATRHYSRKTVVDPLNRMSMYMKDNTIDDDVKKSLKISFEFSKLEVVRSHLILGDRKKALYQLSEIDKSLIPLKRLFITYICFFIPAKVINILLKLRDFGMYEK